MVFCVIGFCSICEWFVVVFGVYGELGWFVVVCVSSMWWLLVACGGLWWLMTACGGLWWLMTACGGF